MVIQSAYTKRQTRAGRAFKQGCILVAVYATFTLGILGLGLHFLPSMFASLGEQAAFSVSGTLAIVYVLINGLFLIVANTITAGR